MRRAFQSLRVTGDDAAPLDTPIPAVQRAQGLIIAVIGGAGKHSAFIPTFGATKPVTRALKRRDGSLAHSVRDFLRKRH